MMDKKCSPHNWLTPKPGDSDLTCPDCGRAMSLLDIGEHRHMEKSIVKSIARRRPNDLAAFKGFLGEGPRADEFHPEGIEVSLLYLYKDRV